MTKNSCLNCRFSTEIYGDIHPNLTFCKERLITVKKQDEKGCFSHVDFGEDLRIKNELKEARKAILNNNQLELF